MNKVLYRAGLRFQVAQDYQLPISILPSKAVYTELISLDEAGNLTIRAGYAWDGATGLPGTPPDLIRGSLVHDALYQLIRSGSISSEYRDQADRILQSIVLEDSGDHAFAEVVYQAVHLLGAPYASADHERPVLEAPSSVKTVVFKDTVQ